MSGPYASSCGLSKFNDCVHRVRESSAVTPVIEEGVPPSARNFTPAVFNSPFNYLPRHPLTADSCSDLHERNEGNVLIH